MPLKAVQWVLCRFANIGLMASETAGRPSRRREPIYKETAHVTLDTNGLSPDYKPLWLALLSPISFKRFFSIFISLFGGLFVPREGFFQVLNYTESALIAPTQVELSF